MKHSRALSLLLSAPALLLTACGHVAAQTAAPERVTVMTKAAPIHDDELPQEPPTQDQVISLPEVAPTAELDLFESYQSEGSKGASQLANTAEEKKQIRLALIDRRHRRAAEDVKGVQTTRLNRAGINSVIAAKRKTLYACFKQEIYRNPSFPGKIPVEFVIGNDGHVAKLWIDHPKLRRGPLHDCMLNRLRKWPFRRFDGEQPTVALAFRLSNKRHRRF